MIFILGLAMGMMQGPQVVMCQCKNGTSVCSDGTVSPNSCVLIELAEPIDVPAMPPCPADEVCMIPQQYICHKAQP